MRALRRWALFASVLFSIAAAGRSAFGGPTASGTRVAVVYGDGLDEKRRGVVHDLPLELRAGGLEVPIVGKVTEDESVDVWAERARALGVRALIHIFLVSQESASIEILLVEPERLRPKSLIRYMPADSSSAVSLSAVEVTRAVILSMPVSPRPSPPEVATASPAAPPTRPPVTPPRKPKRPSPQFSVGALPVVTITGTAPLTVLDLAGTFGISPNPGFEFNVAGALPVTKWSTQVTSGTAHARLAWIDLGATWFVLPRFRWLYPYLGVRTGMLILSSEANGSTSNASDQRTDGSFFGAVAAGASVRLDRPLRLRAEAALGFAAPAFSLRVDDVVLESLGPLLFQFAVGPEFEL